MTIPQTGVCSAWITADDLFDCRPCSAIAVGDRDAALAASVVGVASDLLFRLSDRKYPGVCTDTVRPCGRCRTREGCSCPRLSTARLGVAYPVLSVTTVKVDGVTLVAGTDYRLDDSSRLVRLPDDEAWPTCQDLSLADTEDDTWSVTFTFGRVPSEPAVAAAKALACELYRLCATGTCNLPQRVRTISRQGVEVGFIDPMDFLAEGKTGLYAVDLFLSAERYDAAHRGTAVVNPDVVARATRTG